MKKTYIIYLVIFVLQCLNSFNAWHLHQRINGLENDLELLQIYENFDQKRLDHQISSVQNILREKFGCSVDEVHPTPPRDCRWPPEEIIERNKRRQAGEKL